MIEKYRTLAMGVMSLLAALFAAGYQFLAGEVTLPAMTAAIAAFVAGIGLVFSPKPPPPDDEPT